MEGFPLFYKEVDIHIPNPTKMPPIIINPYPILAVAFIESSQSSNELKSSKSLSILLSNNPPPMAIKIPPMDTFFFISLIVSLQNIWDKKS